VEGVAREVFWIRRGQLVGQTRVTRQTRVTTIARALTVTFADRGAEADGAPIARDKVDEMHLLDTWLQRNDERLTVIQVDQESPASAADAILAAVREQPIPAATSAAGGRRARAS